MRISPLSVVLRNETSMKKNFIYFMVSFLVVHTACAERVERFIANVNTPKLTADAKNNKLLIQIGQKTTQIPLGIPKGFEMENKLRFFGNTEFGLVFVEATDAATATTIIHAINGKGENLWSLDLEAFNASAPLIEKDSIYFSGIGRVLKVTKTTGKVLWQHSNLYENKKFQFNGSEAITRKGEAIEFSTKLHVNDQSGKLIEAGL